MKSSLIKKYRWALSPRRTVIGLTGAPAAGKSAAAGRFEALGATVICADKLAKMALEPGEPGYKAVLGKFGEALLSPDRTINRAALADIVFAGGPDREWLESLLHPQILGRARTLIESSPARVVVVDAPLLFEKNLAGWFDLTVCVRAPDNLRIRRALERGWSDEEMSRRMKSQFSQEQKVAKADVALDNSGSIGSLYRQVDALYHKVTEKFKQKNLKHISRRKKCKTGQKATNTQS